MVDFKYKKAVQALNFFAIQSNGSIEKLKALKLIWLSDRLHIRKYGRPITFDTYYAMKLGPVASATKDLAEVDSKYLEDYEVNYRNQYITPNTSYQYSSINNLDIKVFSKTDIEVLEFIFQKFGSKQKFELSEYTHTLPDWQKYEEMLKQGSTRIRMQFDDFFMNKSIAEYDISDEEHLQLAKELFYENYSLA